MNTSRRPARRSTGVLLALALVSGGAVALSTSPAAAAGEGALLYGLTSDNRLATIDSGTGAVGTPVALAPLASGERVIGIDVRPATGDLLAVIDGSPDRLAVVAPTTGALTPVAPLSLPVSGSSFGVDVDPVTDRVRITSDTAQNLRVDPATGTTTVGGTLSRSGQFTPVTGLAHAGSQQGATTTRLYGIDPNADALLLHDPADAGTLTRVAPLGVDATGEVGFDAGAALDSGFATLTVDGVTGLYAVRLSPSVLTTPAATRLGAFALPGITDIALASTRVSVTSSTAAEGTLATVTVVRTGDLRGTGSVAYTTQDGTAVNGVDYLGAAGTLTFGPGEATRTFTFPVAGDGVTEGSETVRVVLSAPTGGLVLGEATGTVTITDVATSGISVVPGPVEVRESAGTVDVVVTRTPATQPATVAYRTEDGTAVAGLDYTAVSGTLSFAAGQASATVRVTLLADTTTEGSESFAFVLSAPSAGSTLGNARQVITLTGDDARLPTTISSRSSAFVRYPAPVTVAGVLQGAGGAPLGGREVFIVYAPLDNSAAPRVVATVRSQDNGLFSTTLRPTQHGQFAAVYNGSPTQSAAASDTTVSLVQYAIPSASAVTAARAGSTVTVRGTVAPGAVRPKVKLQLINRGGSITDLTGLVTASATGTYALARPFRVPGTFRLRVLAVSTSKNVASSSRTLTLTVR